MGPNTPTENQPGDLKSLNAASVVAMTPAPPGDKMTLTERFEVFNRRLEIAETRSMMRQNVVEQNERVNKLRNGGLENRLNKLRNVVEEFQKSHISLQNRLNKLSSRMRNLYQMFDALQWIVKDQNKDMEQHLRKLRAIVRGGLGATAPGAASANTNHRAKKKTAAPGTARGSASTKQCAKKKTTAPGAARGSAHSKQRAKKKTSASTKQKA